MKVDLDFPTPISDIFLMHPTKVVGVLMPFKNEIEDKYFDKERPSNKFAQRVVDGEIERGCRAVVKDGIDSRLALRHIAACARSGEPDRAHKCAAIALLAEKWMAAFLTFSESFVFSAEDLKNVHTTITDSI